MIMTLFIVSFEKSRASKDPEDYKYEARDIAAFLSAMHTYLQQRGLPKSHHNLEILQIDLMIEEALKH